MALILEGLSSINLLLYLCDLLYLKYKRSLGLKEEGNCGREGVSVTKQGVHVPDLIICIML